MSHKKATPRPWVAHGEEIWSDDGMLLFDGSGSGELMNTTKANAAIAVEAVNSYDALKAQNAELLAEIDRLKALAHVPGLKRCAKCGFQLLTSTMYVESGALGANNKPVDCLNGCGPMWPMTERQAANEAIDREETLKEQNAELVEALTHVTDLLNDPGVGDLEQWKRGVREWTSRARALAKAGGK